MFWSKYPYTNFHELNLDMILRMMKELHEDWDEFKALNTITFDGAWDITKQYPAWCIVNDNGGTQGYISIKPVPAGVIISNTEYWVSIVDYSATIADLQNRVVALENVVGDASSGLVKDVNDILSVYPGKADNNPARRKVLFVGDSYSLDDEWTWPVWWQNVVSHLSITDYLTLQADGAGFADPASARNPDYSGLTWPQILAAYFTADPDVTDVVVAGGYNDHDELEADVKSGMEAFIATARSLYPNAKIWISCVGYSSVYTTEETIMNGVYRYYRDNATKNGCTFIDCSGVWGYSDEFDDSAHPNEEGQYHIGMKIASALITGDYERVENFYITTNCDLVTDTITFRCVQKGNTITFKHLDVKQLNLGGQNVQGDWVALATLDGVYPFSTNRFIGTAGFRIDDTSNDVYIGATPVAFINNKIYIRLPGAFNVNKFYLNAFSVSGEFWGTV